MVGCLKLVIFYAYNNFGDFKDVIQNLQVNAVKSVIN